ncbi:Isochorismatase hydrolase [Xylaria scruposa]|nr:Isochorismatase hydrolase [Xylaria scruposa]
MASSQHSRLVHLLQAVFVDVAFYYMAAQAKIVVGSPGNVWLWSQDSGWDLTRHIGSNADSSEPRLLLKCEISNVAIDPHKTALIIVDMQNFSMCSTLRPDTAVPAVFEVEEMLLKYAIPAARKAEIQIIWLNWGLTESDLAAIPPGVLRVFNFKAASQEVDYGLSQNRERVQCGETPRPMGLGKELGEILLPEGGKVVAGRVLMRDTWNVALHGPLQSSFHEGQAAARQDVFIYKNRNSGLYDPDSELAQYLRAHGICTLLFAGMNTDQCVMATLQDAHSWGYDTILLKNGCATDSPNYAQQSAEYNCCRNWGFLSTCEDFATACSYAEARD